MAMTAAKRLALRQAVEQYSEELVHLADQALSEERMDNLRRMKMKLAQINNFFSVTMETSSPAVVVNWVRYQAGRRERDQKGWSRGGLTNQVVDDIEALTPIARQVAQQVFDDPSASDIRQAHIALIRLYAGYMKRWFVARGGKQR